MKDALELFASRFAPPSLKEGGAVAISSLTGAADAFLALALSKDSRLVLAATPGLPDADRLADDSCLATLTLPLRSCRLIAGPRFPCPDWRSPRHFSGDRPHKNGDRPHKV